METRDNLKNQWASLGIAFNAPRSESVDPETALVSFISSGEFPEDKKMMGLILLWLQHFSKLVHVERLKNLTKDLGAFELAVLGAISQKCIGWGDFRWRTITKIAKKRNTGSPLFKNGDSETFISIKGLDKDFADFGIRVSPTKPDQYKKLLTRQRIFKENLWLKHRMLFGSNVRADIATVMTLKLATTGYAAAKILKCSTNAAYRNWKALEEVGWREA